VANTRLTTSNISYFIKDNLYMILFLLGIALLVFGMLYKTSIGSWFSVVSLFFGIILSTFSMFLKLGMFSLKLRSVAGLGTILICASVISIALAITLFQFYDMTILRYIQVRGTRYYRATCIAWNPTYLWLCSLLAYTSLVLMISGLMTIFFSLMPPFRSIEEKHQ